MSNVARMRVIRSQVLDALGNRCVQCGELIGGDWTLQHADGNGEQVRAAWTDEAAYYGHLLRKLRDDPGYVTLACATCHDRAVSGPANNPADPATVGVQQPKRRKPSAPLTDEQRAQQRERRRQYKAANPDKIRAQKQRYPDRM